MRVPILSWSLVGVPSPLAKTSMMCMWVEDRWRATKFVLRYLEYKRT